MILVLGATGTTGAEVAQQLIDAGERPRLLVRSVEKARRFADSADLVVGDLGDPASLRAAMEGIDRMYLVSTGTAIVQHERHAVDAAVASGVRHVVKLSAIGAEDPKMAFSRWHQTAERQLMESGLAWTVLRPGSFMTSALGWAESIRAQGVFYQPTGTGRWSTIDPADIGAVAVAALTTPGHEGQAYTLTGPDSTDGAGWAAALARALDRPVTFVDVPPDAARQGMLAGGMPPDYAEAVVDLLSVMASGALDVVTPTVQQLLGRAPATMEDWARRHAAAFR